MSRKFRIKEQRIRLHSGEVLIPAKAKKDGHKTNGKNLKLKKSEPDPEEILIYKEVYGDLLTRMGFEGFPYTAFSAYIFQIRKEKIPDATISKWLRNIRHFQINFQIYKSAIEMWKIKTILNPPKVTLKSGKLKSVQTKHGVKLQIDTETVYFKEEQIKTNLFHQNLIKDPTTTEIIDNESREIHKILDVLPTETNVAEWNKQIKHFENTGRKDLMQELFDKIDAEDKAKN